MTDAELVASLQENRFKILSEVYRHYANNNGDPIR
jgi:hypothetical protein